MEDSVKRFYISAIDTLLDRSAKISSHAYDLVYNIVYGKYKGIDKYAEFLSQKIEDKGLIQDEQTELSDEEKETLATYWVICRYTNYTEKKERFYINDNGEKEKISFADLFNEYFGRVCDIFRNKKLKDKRGRVYDGSLFFPSSQEDDLEKEELNEFGILAGLLISAVVFGVGYAVSPHVAKVAPKTCEFIRNASDKYPTLTGIASWIVPADLDAFKKQDMINKGEISEEGEDVDPGDEIIDDTEGYDEENFAAVTQDDLYGGGYEDEDGYEGDGEGEDDILPPGYEYVKSDTYEYGHDYDEEGNYIGEQKSE